MLERAWRPLDAGASASLATSTGGLALAPAGGTGVGGRAGSRIVGGRTGLAAAFGLGAVFAIGWTPCIGPILGSILDGGHVDWHASRALLLIGYTLGLGIPFLLVAVFFDRAQPLLRPLIRHGRAVQVIGGLLVVAIGVLMLFDGLTWIVRFVPFNTGV